MILTTLHKPFATNSTLALTFFFLIWSIHLPQALTTLENIISRLRDLDDGRLTPPASPHNSGHHHHHHRHHSTSTSGSSSGNSAGRQPRSSPASPAPSKKGKRHQSSSPIRQILNSPLLNRRQRKKQQTESSDDENASGGGHTEETSCGSRNYRDLETFQKAQLRQKVIDLVGVASVFVVALCSVVCF